jgi:uncharacterized protein (UPF0264 family)
MKLLVSVRSAAEAEAAVCGGADLIDVKEPLRGSLGRADDAVIADVVRQVAVRRPVSAALGELADGFSGDVVPGLCFVKWGLAGLQGRPWRHELAKAARLIEQQSSTCRPVAVAYADWQRADAPPPADVAAFAAQEGFTALLVDTWRKDGSTLLDWLPEDQLARLIAGVRQGGLRLALAGSLGLPHILGLHTLRPDWFALRGAVCRQGARVNEIDPQAIHHLALALKGHADSPRLDQPLAGTMPSLRP